MGKNKRVDNPIIQQRIKDNLKEKRSLSKKLSKEKRARLIVKNLSFKATEDNIKEFFEKYGVVENVDLLKKPDGKLVGCAFIQFKLVQLAAKARHYANNQSFLGRNITVDFAKSKHKYKKEKSVRETNESTEKENDHDNSDIKDEKDDLIEIKDETKKEINIESDEEDDDVHEDVLLKEESDPDTDSETENEEEHNVEEVEEPPSKKSRLSHDINEGRTVFVKNLPFQAKKDDLKKCFSQFGPIYYALVCMDKLTEHSKGTGFVKFVNKEDAEKALSAGTELTLLGNILDCHPALERDQLQKKFQQEKDDKKQPKDSRNLYLVKEGVILAGTKAAEGVSASDMAKRLQIEQYKTQMLRKLNTFVARDRLVVHNLPLTWDDQKLRALFLKHGGKGAFVKEARVMRDMRHPDAKGVGPSKEYGFVTFSSHEHALNALRSLNNNPNVFSSQKRPIITFSIESKTALNAKKKRLEKSKQKNPKSKEYNPELAQNDGKKNSENGAEMNPRSKKNKFRKKEAQNTVENNEENLQSFAGVTSRKGQIQKMRSRYKLSTQAKLHAENLKKEKNKRKTAKKTLEQKKKDFIKQPKQKINKKNHEDNFSKMVSDYKSKILNASGVQKRKWSEY